MPKSKLAIPAYYVMRPLQCSCQLVAFRWCALWSTAVKPGEFAADLYTRSRREGFGKEVKRRILMGPMFVCGYHDAYYIKAQKSGLISEDFKNALAEVDAIMGPVTPATAFGIGEKIGNPIEMYLSDIYTIAINLAVVLPCQFLPGFAEDMPVRIANYR